MTHLSFSAIHRHSTGSGLAAAVRGLVGEATRAWRTRRASRAMAELSDAALHDIGVTRGEIDAAVRFGRPRR